MGRQGAMLLCLIIMVGRCFGGVGWKVDVRDAKRWRPMVFWLSNPSPDATVTTTDEGLQFTVPEAGKGMKWLTKAHWVNTKRFRYLVVRYKASGINTRRDDYFVWVNDGSGRPDLTLLRLSDLKSDGQWHTIVVDMYARKIRPYLIGIALQVQAEEPHAFLVLAEMSLRDIPPEGVPILGPPQRPSRPYRERVLPLQWFSKLQPQPTWLANPSEKASIAVTPEGIRFRIPEAGRGMKWRLILTPPLRLQDTPFLVLDYQAVGIAPLHDYFLYTAPKKPTFPQKHYHAIWLDELIPDGKWHRLVVPLPKAAQEEFALLALQVQAESADAEVIIKSLRFSAIPQGPREGVKDGTWERLLPPTTGKPLLSDEEAYPLDLTGRFNASLCQLLPDLSARSFRFIRTRLLAGGVPFRVSTKSRNVISVSGATGTIIVPVTGVRGKTPSEVYLLLAACFPEWEEPSYGGGRLWRIRHPHRFIVELCYDDGMTDTFFPVRVMSRRPEIVLGLDVYVIPVRGRLQEIRLHDRMPLGEFGLCGVTLNLGKPRFNLKLWRSRSLLPSNQRPLRPPQTPRFVYRNGLVMENANLRVRIGIKPLRLAELTLLPIRRPILTAPTPLFSIRSWDGKLSATSEDYRLASSEVSDKTATLVLHPPSDVFPEVTLTFHLDAHRALEVKTRLKNLSETERRWVVEIPSKWSLQIGDNDLYTYPLRTVIINDAEVEFRFRYGGNIPLQFLDLSAPDLGIGVCFLTKDLEGQDRFVTLGRKGSVTTFGIEWRCDPVGPQQTLPLPPLEIFVHSGGWREAFQRYKGWVQTWYHPLAPRKTWFRRVFAFRQDYLRDGLFDFPQKAYRFWERTLFAREAFGACDYLHIFDWGATLRRGRVGDYDPWGNRLGHPSDFRRAVMELQGRGIPVGLYIEGYLVDVRSRVGRKYREAWGLRRPDGSVQLWAPRSPEFVMCPGVKGWQDYLTDVYRRVRDETRAKGFYIDQFGFCHRVCYADGHDHPPDWNVLRGEGLLTRKVREALPPECVLYTESFPPDIHTILQDGSFDYAINAYQRHLSRWMPVPVRLGRFAFPDFKVFQIIVCDRPIGTNEEAVCQVFFNGDGFWIQGDPDTWFRGGTLKVLRRALKVLREHADAFSSDRCEPLVPTLIKGVFANRFEADGKIIWTLYNGNWYRVVGEVLAVPHRDGARYWDAWNERPVRPRFKGDTAYLSAVLNPHGVGCLVQEWGQER